MRPHDFVGCVAAALFLVVGTAQGFQAESNSDTIFRQADRDLRQALVRAERAIEQGDFADAVDEIGKLLAESTTDDYFLTAPDSKETRTSLKAEAERLLSILPQRGRDLYELKFGAEAKALLETALQDGSSGKLSEVVRRYFHTKAGVEAAILLGRLQLDRGQSLSAALTFRRVLAVPGSASFDPELSLLLAVAWHQSQRPEEAQSVLAKLTAKGPVQLKAGEAAVQLNPTDDPAVWLNKLVGLAQPRGAKMRDEWCLFGGDEQRNASVVGGKPLSDFRWRVKTVGDPRDERYIRDIKPRMKDANFGFLPSAQPLAIGDSLLMRGAERMWAVDSRTGKIMWEYPWDESEKERLQRNQLTSATAPNREVARKQELQQRLWEDYAYGQLSSDGEAVFVLDDLQVVPNSADRRMLVPGGRIVINPLTSTTTHNQLVALELHKQGKLKWIVGGEKGNDEPKLTDHFFLGAPLPIMGQLLALAEKDGEIRLVVLDGKTGKLDWSQQVAHMNEASIRLDSLRRLAGATPSFAEGLVICPTTGGAVVAVDWSKRSLAWGYSYKRSAAPIIQPRFGGFAMPNDSSQTTNSPKWTTSAAIIADGKVIVTPPDSNEIHCLDLVTGKPVWAPRDRSNSLTGMLYVGCVHQGKIIVVGKRAVTAIHLKDGTDAWTLPLEPLAGGPAGRGVYSQPHYWLPTVRGDLLQLDLENGKILGTSQTEMPLGNLIVHRGEIISLSPDYLAAYYLREHAEKKAEELLAKNANDGWALARKGEIALQDGKQAVGLDLLRSAHKHQPDDETARARLLKSLLGSLTENNPQYTALVTEIEPLITQPAERAEFLRRTAEVLVQKGTLREAFDKYLALATISAQLQRQGRDSNSLEELQAGWRVRSDRWLYSRLAGLYNQADAETKRALDAAIQQRVSQANLTPAQRQSITSLFAFHPDTYSARLSTIDKTVESRGILAGELELTPLLKNGTPENRAHAISLMAKLMESNQRHLEAAWWLNQLGTEFADVRILGEQTGKQVQAAAAERAAIAREIPSPWPAGKVVVDAEGEPNSRIPSYQRLQSIVVSTQGAIGPGQSAVLDTSRSAVVIRDPLGRKISEFPLSREGGRSYYQVVQGAMYGHLLVLSTGTEVLAVDTLQRGSADLGRDSAIWRYETSENSNRFGGYVQTRTLRNPFGRPRTVSFDQQNKPLSTSIAVGPWGVAFVRARSLICVHPLTGEVLWERAGFESATEIVADETQLYAIPYGSEEGQVFSAWDGAKLGVCRVPKSDNRLYTCGSNLLSWSETSTDISLQLRQLSTGQEIWSQAFAPGSHACPIGNDEIAVLQPTGQLVIVSLVDGRTRLHTKIEPESALMGLYVQRTQDRYFVITNHPSRETGAKVTYTPGLPNNAVLICGRVYAFDRTTRKAVWPTPAYVHQQGFIPDQPTELPVLMFVRTQNSSAAKSVTSLLCLDKRTGGVLIDTEKMSFPIHAYEIVGNREKNQVVVTLFGSSQRTFTLNFTDQPTPPMPPAQLGPMSSLSVGSLPGNGVNVAGAVFDAINDAFTPKRAVPPADDPFK